MSDLELDLNNISLSTKKHDRLSGYNRLVYPVISRRSNGLSIGINLNPDRHCTYNCIYCQVDRKQKKPEIKPNDEIIIKELENWFKLISSQNGFYRDHQLKDIAFAGDGEPTLYKNLPSLIEKIIILKKAYSFETVKIILFTNGSGFVNNKIVNDISLLLNDNAEIWFKLDFWDELSFRKINQSKIGFEKIVSNLKRLSGVYPVVIQSCLFSYNETVYSNEFYHDFVEFILGLLKDGVKIKYLQAYTLARKPSDEKCQPWPDKVMDQIEIYLQKHLPFPIKTYYQSI